MRIRRRISPEVLAARLAVRASQEQAAQDRVDSAAAAADAEMIASGLGQHNTANHYNRWLQELWGDH